MIFFSLTFSPSASLAVNGKRIAVTLCDTSGQVKKSYNVHVISTLAVNQAHFSKCC